MAYVHDCRCVAVSHLGHDGGAGNNNSARNAVPGTSAGTSTLGGSQSVAALGTTKSSSSYD